ncbi:hypothetical protein OS493_000572 [Desmophyllum pertusum]|uniref:Uncharacterized protein n=1 Tax=Desmophyllum pertusum TaxID=174260 RepID=A0A9X0A7F5_9CNID|nr:hypothetical protein OS493_000572 [Desmophyllum pertusum]
MTQQIRLSFIEESSSRILLPEQNFEQKTQFLRALPKSNVALQSKHPDSDIHHESNQRRQAKQSEYYNRRTGSDKETLSKSQPVYVWNTLKRIWEPGKILSHPNPVREPRTDIVEMNDKLYQRTREHLRPRSINKDPPMKEHDSILDRITYATDTHAAQPHGSHHSVEREVTTPIPPDKAPTPTEAVPTTEGGASPVRHGPDSEVIVVEKGKASFQPRSQLTRSGRMTQVPSKFKD